MRRDFATQNIGRLLTPCGKLPSGTKARQVFRGHELILTPTSPTIHAPPARLRETKSHHPLSPDRPRQGARCILPSNALSRNRPPAPGRPVRRRLAAVRAVQPRSHAHSPHPRRRHRTSNAGARAGSRTRTASVPKSMELWPYPNRRFPSPARPSPSCSAPRTGPKATPSSPTDPSTWMAPSTCACRRGPTPSPSPRAPNTSVKPRPSN